MKTKLVLISAFLFIFSINAYAQQVKIASEKVVYKRTFRGVPDHKKTFEIIYPKISGAKNASVAANLENALSYWKNFGMNLDEELRESYGLDAAEYVVNYNKNSVLDVTLMMDVSGAYPTTLVKNLVIDLDTGNRVYIRDAFTDVGQLLVRIDKAKRAAEKKALEELKKDDPEDAASLRDTLREKRLSVATLEEFSVTDRGVTFHYDYGFPHVIRALEPDGKFSFSWAEIKPFIKPGGLLARFVR